MIKNISGALKAANQYIDLKFLAKFIGLFLVFYYGNRFWVYFSIPGGRWYNEAFAAKYANYNYISWITASLAHMSNYIGHLIGMDCYVRESGVLSTTSGHSVYIEWPCIGLGIYSFWLAFMLSQKMNLKKKLLLGFGGAILIWLINCVRISLLLLALEHNLRGWKKNLKYIGEINHHDMYNYVCYIIIIGMIYLYYRLAGKKEARLKVNTNNSGKL